ncbi:hypothetical protein MYMA111404_03390 [Mycoplasma marinum]|uniref:Lipoprotein n=1 Tax=Mycoplasma marinum TaxID=1937190 RepID=A0A4R0XKR5_9MOLU|nr:hypothetical protein [Mycoplasma marinum]TCG11054.1 hypothetical protein C4B24_03150 [Mycoplasma marinum]
MKRTIKLGSIAAASIVALPIIVAVSCGTPNLSAEEISGNDGNTIGNDETPKINFTVKGKPVVEKTFKIVQSPNTLNIGKDYKNDEWVGFNKQIKTDLFKKYLTPEEYDIWKQASVSISTKELDKAIKNKNEKEINSSLFKIKELLLGKLVPLMEQIKVIPIKITYTDKTKNPKKHSLTLNKDVQPLIETFKLLWSRILIKTEVQFAQNNVALSLSVDYLKNGFKTINNSINSTKSELNDIVGSKNDPLIEAYAIDNKITKLEAVDKIFGTKVMNKKITDWSKVTKNIKQKIRETEDTINKINNL